MMTEQEIKDMFNEYSQAIISQSRALIPSEEELQQLSGIERDKLLVARTLMATEYSALAMGELIRQTTAELNELLKTKRIV